MQNYLHPFRPVPRKNIPVTAFHQDRALLWFLQATPPLDLLLLKKTETSGAWTSGFLQFIDSDFKSHYKPATTGPKPLWSSVLQHSLPPAPRNTPPFSGSINPVRDIKIIPDLDLLLQRVFNSFLNNYRIVFFQIKRSSYCCNFLRTIGA